MHLHELLVDIVPAALDMVADCHITELVSDSRKVDKDCLFFAYPGIQQDGRNYMQQAMNKGAAAILYETKDFPAESLHNQNNIPLIAVDNLQAKIGEIAARFFGYPSKNMIIIGITGTNGKTSCSHFIANVLQNSGCPCGIIGTLGTGMPNQLKISGYTTPDPIGLQKNLYDLYKQGAKAISMEVSSHAIAQHRIAGINFTASVFTNLSLDHLDFHGSMENYAESKRQLFLRSELKHAIINADDDFGYKLLQELTGKLSVVGYSMQSHETYALWSMIKAYKLNYHTHGFSALIKTPWGEGKLESSLLGRFNVSNLLAVLGTVLELGMPFQEALQYLAKLQNVIGRMQTFGGGEKPLVIVDFAHTPDALEKVLKVLREHCHGRLWCVFGCGGDRDRSKRPIMGKIAELYSDHVIVTDDNPRTENPKQIVQEIMQGFLCPWAMELEHDRAVAINYAVHNAQIGDIVLIAGKGHESYQIVGTEKIPFSDIEQVKICLDSK